MSDFGDIKHRLPTEIEKYLSALSKIYALDGKRELQQIIVNASLRIEEGYSYDNWNGGIYGHAIYFTLPEELYLPIAKTREPIQEEITKDLNALHDVQNEFIDKVFIEPQFFDTGDWRKESGLLISAARSPSPEAAKRIWDEGHFRIFLSHKSEVKRETALLKANLKHFGISAFVAHEDIHPTKEWQDEIENALAGMDAFIALMTSDFHDSNWTDQEVGYALARGVPIIAVRLGRDPYGFLGKFQGLSTTWADAAPNIVKLLLKNERMVGAYLAALKRCPSFDVGNLLSTVLPAIERLTVRQIDDLVSVYNENSELQGSFGFSGTKPQYWGNGLVPHLNRLGERSFIMRPTHPRHIHLASKRKQPDLDDEIPF